MNRINDALRAVSGAHEEFLDGVTVRRIRYERNDGSQFAACAVIAKPFAARMISGTAGGGYTRMDSTDYVPQQIRSAMAEGLPVIAGINAGYFRRKWHFTPYGLSIQKGVEISPPHSEPRVLVGGGIELGTLWLGVTPDTQLIFGNEADYPKYRGKLAYAIGFSHYLVAQGESCLASDQGDTSFEPRSAFGLGKDGSMILLAIDGRQEGYSTGATNWETAQVLLDLGAETGINLDGGGSTHLAICSKDGAIATVNQPCENRKVFDTILLVSRQM